MVKFKKCLTKTQDSLLFTLVNGYLTIIKKKKKKKNSEECLVFIQTMGTILKIKNFIFKIWFWQLRRIQSFLEWLIIKFHNLNLNVSIFTYNIFKCGKNTICQKSIFQIFLKMVFFCFLSEIFTYFY